MPETVERGLNCNLLIRNSKSRLMLNFDVDLLALIKEVQYLRRSPDISVPEEAIQVKLKKRNQLKCHYN